MSFFQKYKWYILGGLGLVGLGVLTAMATSVSRLKNRKPKKILFVGDSISTGSSTYPAKIQKQRSDLDIDVLSKGGMRTSWMLDNLKDKLASNKYDRVYIYGGVNDMFSSVKIDDALSNIQQMVNMINENGADAFVIQGYVIDGFMDLSKFSPSKYVPEVSGFIPLIERYREYQSRIPKTIKNAHFVKPINLGDRTGDGIHPSGTGQQIIADEILKTI
jgi:lysophospholipase L1-like esterase